MILIFIRSHVIRWNVERQTVTVTIRLVQHYQEQSAGIQWLLSQRFLIFLARNIYSLQLISGVTGVNVSRSAAL